MYDDACIYHKAGTNLVPVQQHLYWLLPCEWNVYDIGGPKKREDRLQTNRTNTKTTEVESRIVWLGSLVEKVPSGLMLNSYSHSRLAPLLYSSSFFIFFSFIIFRWYNCKICTQKTSSHLWIIFEQMKRRRRPSSTSLTDDVRHKDVRNGVLLSLCVQSLFYCCCCCCCCCCHQHNIEWQRPNCTRTHWNIRRNIRGAMPNRIQKKKNICIGYGFTYHKIADNKRKKWSNELRRHIEFGIREEWQTLIDLYNLWMYAHDDIANTIVIDCLDSPTAPWIHKPVN